MDDEPVLVDESTLDERRCERRPTTDLHVAPEFRPEPSERVDDIALDEGGWSPGRISRLVEKTIFGFAFQIRAKSSIAGVAAGSDSAVGQYAAMTSYRRRP